MNEKYLKNICKNNKKSLDDNKNSLLSFFLHVKGGRMGRASFGVVGAEPLTDMRLKQAAHATYT